MVKDLYEPLCDTLTSISGAAEQHSPSFLGPWRQWAATVIAGLYYGKTARQAAQSARLVAEGCEEGSALSHIAWAAAHAADAVVAAALHDVGAARAQAARARDTIEKISARKDEAAEQRLGSGFDGLAVRDEVRFVAELGENGPQVSIVRRA